MKLNILFLDMNAYFASVEQQFRPELRGRPVAVVPVLADSTCCIACSYEAKPFGVKTGVLVREAKQLCPDLRIVEARPSLYVRVHHRIIRAVESCLHVDAIHSIDEMSCKLMRGQGEPEPATALARQVKETMRERVGEMLRCSIGLAPNCFLAKVGADMQKPDGLTIITREDLPEKLYPLELTDLAGIGPRMERRLHAHGIHTVKQLYALSADDLERVWQSIVGRRWWHWLHGDEVELGPVRPRSLGHSHVLPPEFRTPDGAWAVLMRLLHKAAARLRARHYWATHVLVHVSCGHRQHWHARTNVGLSQDTLTLAEAAAKLWAQRPPGQPFQVGVVLEGLVEDRYATQPLFTEERRRVRLSRTIDCINLRFGDNAVYLASIHHTRQSAPMRIAFTSIPEVRETD